MWWLGVNEEKITLKQKYRLQHILLFSLLIVNRSHIFQRNAYKSDMKFWGYDSLNKIVFNILAFILGINRSNLQAFKLI